MSDSEQQMEQAEERSRAPLALIIAGVIVVAVAIFVAQNTEDVEIEFLLFKGTLPLWLVILIFLVLGALLGQALLWIRRRRKRRQANDAVG